MKRNIFYVSIKSVIFLGLFIILHYLYDWFPNEFTSIISGINESFFQHMKIGFFAYILLFIIEFIIFNKKIDNKSTFLFTRLFTTIIIPLFFLLIWYFIPAIYGRIPNIVVEIIFANIVTFLSAFFGIVIEINLEKIKLSISMKAVILILFVFSIIFYIIFTFKLPWTDLFQEPPI